MAIEQPTWTPVRSYTLPQNGCLVEVITPGGDQRQLRYRDGLWWLPDGSMYVYFTPEFWREAEQ